MAAKLAAMTEEERIAWKAKRNAMLQQRRDEHAAKRERLEKVPMHGRRSFSAPRNGRAAIQRFQHN